MNYTYVQRMKFGNLARPFVTWEIQVWGKINPNGLNLDKTNHEEDFAWTCAAAAKSLQSCPTLCDPIDSSPPGSPVPGILQARTLEWVAISFSSAWKWQVKVKSLSHVWLLGTPCTAAYQAPPSMGFSREPVLDLSLNFPPLCTSSAMWVISCHWIFPSLAHLCNSRSGQLWRETWCSGVIMTTSSRWIGTALLDVIQEMA